VAVHCYTSGQPAAAHVQEYGLTFPIVLDLDSQIFRRLRLPGHVFPLNAVIDPQGSLAYLGPDLDDALAVAQGIISG